jgi:hypothetical protein
MNSYFLMYEFNLALRCVRCRQRGWGLEMGIGSRTGYI